MKFLLLLTLFGFAVNNINCSSFYDVVMEEWELFKGTHNKTYDHNVEEMFRMKVYVENKLRIAEHNKLYVKGERSFAMKMNHFGDLLPHEFRSLMNGYRRMANTTVYEGASYIGPDTDVTLPQSVDWREKGAVTPIKNQGQCGSCWAFSTTGALEGQHFRQTGDLVSLSEQNLVDCSWAYGNQGCGGGLMDNAFTYIKNNHGIDTETSYPYEGEDLKCHFKKSDVGAEDVGYVDIPKGNEQALKAAIAIKGPVAVAIDASQMSFQFYHHGVYSDPNCSPENLDHGVLAVGYGTCEKEGKDYWLVKNSWGTGWGMEGYIKMARNENNACGIASSASYPLV